MYSTNTLQGCKYIRCNAAQGKGKRKVMLLTNAYTTQIKLQWSAYVTLLSNVT